MSEINLEKMGAAAKEASWKIAALSSTQKNKVLQTIADNLEANAEIILNANAQDMKEADANGLSEALKDRLRLDETRLSAIAQDVRQVATLSDPVGEVMDGGILDSGLQIERRRVPLGVVGVIYEARPNVTVDVASLCLKTGNAVILRGGKETFRTNAAIVSVIQKSLAENHLPSAAIQAIDNPDRKLVAALLKLDKYIDMLIPRGGAGLHKLCREQSTIPVITGGIGVCHLYLDETADFEKSLPVIENAKIQRPSACNSLETLLVNRQVAADFLPLLAEKMEKCGVTLHLDDNATNFFENAFVKTVPATEEDYAHEFLSKDLNVKIVEDFEAALAHIRHYGTQHSDGILTQSVQNAENFIKSVDSAAVYVNASTRFSDGAQFGLGAEVAVSTQKLHARGPMGLEALTTYKWIVRGDYTSRA